MSIWISKLYIEDQVEPLGLDEKKPSFSWRLEADELDVKQSACRICVKEHLNEGVLNVEDLNKEDLNETDLNETDLNVEDLNKEHLIEEYLIEKLLNKEHSMWDSGILNTSESKGIVYAGEELQPCTKYDVIVQVWDEKGNMVQKQSSFETGFLNPELSAWDGAKWIAAPRYTVSAQNRGVFVIETEFRLSEGSDRAGVVFGANDFRLLDKTKNELGIEGENYIRFEINLSKAVPSLDIYRVGYAPDDLEEVPFASVPIVNLEGEEKQPLIVAENKYDFHKLKIEIDGNNSYSYIDDVLVDALFVQTPVGTLRKGRILNPRGHNDVLTYPRLNEIGFFAGDKDKAFFKHLTVRNLRHPSKAFIVEKPEGNLYGGNSIFAGLLPVEEECFAVTAGQYTVDPSNTSIPMFRSNIKVDENKTLQSARLYITSRGIYECKVNGDILTDRLLAPGITQYDKQMNYQTYDITDKLKSGTNGIGVTLSSGWWSDAQTFCVANYNYFGDKEALLAKLVVNYSDGTKDILVTDTDTWKYYGEGPYVYSGFFAGEIYDARKEDIYQDYANADYDDSDWETPVIYEAVRIDEYRAMPFGRAWPEVNAQEPILIGGYDAPVYIIDKRYAKTVKEEEPGVYIYDLEQEMAGVPRITFHEKAGTKVTIRYAEVLYPDLPAYAGNVGKMMLENYRDASSTDIYICSGSEGENYQPKFTFHGYRYIEISGVSNPPSLSEVVSLQYSSVLDFEGSFQCSDQLLNRFVENVSWSQKCNFINIPTDCPQRNERMGWAGDTHIFCETAVMNSPLKKFYERYLQALADLQSKEGQFPEIAPVGGGFGGITYECAAIFMCWDLYQHYGDLQLLKKFYPGMKKYMDYMKDKGLGGNGAVNMEAVGPLADWLSPEETDPLLMWNAFYYREAVLMSKMAKILGKTGDVAEFDELALKVKKYWNETFVDPDSKKALAADGSVNDTQCAYALPIYYGIVEDTQAARAHLVRKTREVGHRVYTGFFSTGLLNKVLTESGYAEDAYKLILQTAFPSWLYPVTQGATTIWERWDSYTNEKGFGENNSMNSFNHYSLGSVLSWIYSCILGIQKQEEYPGYEHFELKPYVQALDYAKGSISTPYGVIKSSWSVKGNEITYQCEIPVNTSATLKLPDESIRELSSGTYEFVYKKN